MPATSDLGRSHKVPTDRGSSRSPAPETDATGQPRWPWRPQQSYRRWHPGAAESEAPAVGAYHEDQWPSGIQPPARSVGKKLIAPEANIMYSTGHNGQGNQPGAPDQCRYGQGHTSQIQHHHQHISNLQKGRELSEPGRAHFIGANQIVI